MRSASRPRRQPVLLALLALATWCALLSNRPGSLVEAVSVCWPGTSPSMAGFPICSAAGSCVPLAADGSDTLGSSCFCDVARYESDGAPSITSSAPSCTSSMRGASAALVDAGTGVMGSIVLATLLASLTCFVRVTFRKPGRETRFERLKIAGVDVLKPTPVQLRFARGVFALTSVAALIWTIDMLADPFAQEDALNKAGGQTRKLQEDGTVRLSGLRLREVLEDATELLLFIAYLLFFLLFRKVCAPAPALLSGNRFRKDWQKDSAATTDSLRQHDVFVARSLELVAQEQAADEAAEKAGEEDDSPEARAVQWAREQARALYNTRNNIGLSEVKEEHRAGARKAALERHLAMQRSQPEDIPPPPPSPPHVPAPPFLASPSKNAAKYAVSPDDYSADEIARAPIVRPTPLARSGPAPLARSAPTIDPELASPSKVASPPKAASHFATKRRNLLEGLDDDEAANEVVASVQARPGSEAAHAQHQYDMEIAEARLRAVVHAPIPSDAVCGVAEEDLASFPAPDGLKILLLTHFTLAFILIILWVMADLLLEMRLLFSGGLFAFNVILHLWHGWWLLSYWQPYYLISLKEELLVESGITLPKHRQIATSTGSETSAPTSTLSFGIATAYELSKVHSIYLYFMLATIIATLCQNGSMLVLGFEDQQTMHASTYICFYLLNKLLQCTRLASILVVFYPFQPIIQYLTLHSFWLDQRLEWAASAPEPAFELQLLPQFQHTDLEQGIVSPSSAASAASGASVTSPRAVPPPPQQAVDPFPSTRIGSGWLPCVPLFLTTSFRPIPSRDELEAKAQADMLPKLLADLKRMRALDRQTHGEGGGGITKGLGRLWRAGAKHEKLQTEDVLSAAMKARFAESQAFEQAIAHQQFVLWRRAQMKARGWNEYGEPITAKARSEARLAEKLVREAAEATTKANEARAAVAAAAMAKNDATAREQLAAASPTLTPSNDDPFANIQETYGDPDGSLRLAVVRAQAKADRAVLKAAEKDRLQEEFRKLRAIQLHAAAASSLSKLPPLGPVPVPTHNGPTMRVKVALPGTRAVLVRAAAAAAVTLAASSASTSAPDIESSKSTSGSHLPLLLPGALTPFGITSDEMAGLEFDADDFVSVSRSMAHVTIDTVDSPR